MNITAISFSYSDDSMNHRGLLLMNRYLNFKHIIKMNLPMCNSNKPDGDIPNSVETLDRKLKESDVLVFAIPEYTGHYSVGFKNLMDWLVVKAYYNADLGQQYSISNKPVHVITFTPAKKGVGDRHFDMTKDILTKLGSQVKNMWVKNDCWENLTPNNHKFIEKECKKILKKDMKDEVGGWQQKYNDWNNKWKN